SPVLAKHSKNFSLEDSLAIGIDRMQRNFGPLKQQVEEWQALQLSTASAKLLIYQAFIEDELGFPKHLARRVHELYFQPVHEEFQPRTMWSLSNAFSSAFKEPEPIPQYKATAKLAGFLVNPPGGLERPFSTRALKRAPLVVHLPSALLRADDNARFTTAVRT